MSVDGREPREDTDLFFSSTEVIVRNYETNLRSAMPGMSDEWVARFVNRYRETI